MTKGDTLSLRNSVKSLPLSFSVVIPAYNEEESIAACLESVLNQTVTPDRIVVVNDGSTDRTREILERYADRVLIVDLNRNTGNKALALREALPFLVGDVVVYTDADSELEPDAFEKVISHFFDPRVGGVSGNVWSRRHNILTGIRQLQYIVGQEIYKRGMSVINTVMVIPGCVGAVRREMFDPSPDTITEDMDLTLSVIKKGYAVVYNPEAVAWTSDPPNLRSYINQTRRWFSGFFQNMRKHFSELPWRIKIQMVFLSLENVLFSMAAAMMVLLGLLDMDVLAPLLFLAADHLSWAVIAIYGSITRKRRDLLKSVPLMLLSRFVDNFIWIYAMFSELVFRRRDLNWHRADRFDLKSMRTNTGIFVGIRSRRRAPTE